MMGLLAFRIRHRITSSVAPDVHPEPVDVKVRAHEFCCPCCEPPCATPDQHTMPCFLHLPGDAS